MIKKPVIIFLIFICIFPEVNAANNRNPVSGHEYMISTADKFATGAGIDVLKKGGNAIDAAVTIGFVLSVTYPQAGNIGGGGFMIIRTTDKKIYSLDFREKAPEKAYTNMYLDNQGNVISNLSIKGYLASGVPGTVAGLYQAHKKFGQKKWHDLLEYAIKLAEEGFELERHKADAIKHNFEDFIKFDASRKIFTKNGQYYEEKDILRQTDLAQTLKRIQKNKTEGFYKGKTAQLIAQDMSVNGGLITTSDLNNYETKWREPIHFNYRGFDIYSMAPPSSGGIVLGQILNTLENIDLQQLGHNSSELIHFWVEAEKYAYADRAMHLGDPDYYIIPVDRLLSKQHGKKIFASIHPFRATPSTEISASDFPVKESMETTHFSVVDKWGNAVACTYTLNGSFGSSVVINGTGILMNNEMDDFSVKAGTPNMYGLTGNEVNSISPGKRMLSSMTPTIITRDDSLFLILGSPGGSTIITTVAQVISNVIDHKMNIRIAVESPRFHHQWLPDEIKYEKTWFARDVLNNLIAKGHKLRGINSLGSVQAILWDNKYKEWTGWSDPRQNGLTIGY